MYVKKKKKDYYFIAIGKDYVKLYHNLSILAKDLELKAQSIRNKYQSKGGNIIEFKGISINKVKLLK